MNLKLGAIIIAISALLAIFLTIRIFRKNRLSTRFFLIWLFIWFSIGFFALFPSVLDKLMKLANMGNRLFFLTSGAILILYIMIFYLTSTLSRMNRKISRLTIEIALINFNLEKKEKEDSKVK